MTLRRSITLFALFGIGALALTGCVTTTAGPAATDTAAPGGGATTELEVDAGWLDGGRAVALVTLGSSTCVPSASDVAQQADGSVAVTLVDVEDAACTRDLVPRATLVTLPEGVDGARDLDLVVTYGETRGDTDLDAYAGGPVEEYTPSAGWIDDGLFAILTWGSSSCAPVVDVVSTVGSEVTVSFIEPAADQVCTMDMAPRVALATVAGDVDDDAATVTLTGGGAEFATPVTVPIAG